MNKKIKQSISARILSVTLSLTLLFSSSVSAFADNKMADGAENEFAISIYDGKEANQNGKLTYTITNSTDGKVSPHYSTADTNNIYAVAGDTITLYPVANEGYVLNSIGYTRSERVERSFVLKEATKDKTTGNYTFTMPDYGIKVGSSFFQKDSMYVLNGTDTKNSIANVDSKHVLYLGLNNAWLHQNAETVSVDMHIDKRITELDNITFRMEIRESGDGNYTLMGQTEYTSEQLHNLIKGTETKIDEKSREYYILRDIKINVDEDKDFNLKKEVYCTAQFTLPGWTNAIGGIDYYWGYSGGDKAFILENDVPIPTPMVYLYNFDSNTYQGALVAAELEKMKIKARYLTNTNMGQTLGYLAEWPGYTAKSENDAYSDKTFKKKIVIYCNLPSMVRDELIDRIRETGAKTINNKLTKYGAEKSFVELYKNLETESEVFGASLALSLLGFEASKAVTEEKYGKHELWNEFQTVMAKCKDIILSTTELPTETYKNARLELLDVYLKILGKVHLTTDFVFVLDPIDDANYKVTVKAKTAQKDLDVTYRWFDGSKENYFISKKDELYKINCNIKGTEDGKYYGFKHIKLSAPEDPKHTVSASNNSVSVSFQPCASVDNIPEPFTYIAELYKGDTLIATNNNKTAETIVFSGLSQKTEYKVKAYATNIVGHSTIFTETVTTTASSSSTGGGSSSGSSGGQSSSNVSTTSNSDGSTTTTETDSNTGAITQTTKHPNGSKTVMVTKKDGYKTVTIENKDGAASTTTISSNSKAETSVKLPSTIVAEAISTSKIIKLPMPDVSAVSTSINTTCVTVNTNSNSEVKVQVPVKNPTLSTVAVLVKPDGSEEIIKTTMLTADGIILTVANGAKVKIVDNSKSFSDVASSSWASSAVDFVSSRELFSGIGANAFGPEGDMTRGMLMTVLSRFDGQDISSGKNWLSAGMNWAKANNISDSSTPNGNVTREQVAVMLYRYAGSPKVDADDIRFVDAGKVSTYAQEAIRWAAKQGIMSGKTGNVLDPHGNATRAQVAQILKNYAEYLAK